MTISTNSGIRIGLLLDTTMERIQEIHDATDLSDEDFYKTVEIWFGKELSTLYEEWHLADKEEQ